ncbi:pH regulation protein F [Halorhodospira sp. 9621]|uniref:pH regulation protein F n=1 Tax=Halorhodospira TaxID=85108 RepID=UPI001EE7A4FB|nr:MULTISPECIES: pH regulation protein F [Halorhodospira]MCG5529062.1 pH regulation protein F [Halorhodospira halophila]MCG5534154.1 pH regulation protein F [Halorhodospira sp. 9621]MCG5543177.1 pH regulation protein F [Halorhodospira sp. 9628]
MLDWLLPAIILFLLGNLIAGLWRIWRGPSDADRMLSALLFGSTSAAVLILLAEWQGVPALRIAALLVVMLATILTITYVGTTGRGSGRQADRQPEDLP